MSRRAAGPARSWSTFPKDIQFAKGMYVGPKNIQHKTYRPKLKGDLAKIKRPSN
jgi:hypothetical protein